MLGAIHNTSMFYPPESSHLYEIGTAVVPALQMGNRGPGSLSHLPKDTQSVEGKIEHFN